MEKDRFRNACFTLNNYTEEEYNNILESECTYVIIGKEVGKEGTPHLQGYIEWGTNHRFSKVKKLLGERAHIEKRRGTQKQAIVYCKKDGSFVEKGKPKEQGKRTDLDKVRTVCVEKAQPMNNVVMWANLQQIRVAEIFLTYREQPRDWLPNVIWIWGPSGIGKSRLARELCPTDPYTKSSDTKWWNGYDGHESVIIDDFRDDTWSMNYLLDLLDRYECRIEYKGGYRQFRAKHIIITTIIRPEKQYADYRKEPIIQLLRRINLCIQLSWGEGRTVIRNDNGGEGWGERCLVGSEVGGNTNPDSEYLCRSRRRPTTPE